MKIAVTTLPAVEPVTLAEFKAQIRGYADLTDEDELLITYLQAAREMIEEETGVAMITQTAVMYLPRFPRCWDALPRVIEIGRNPVQSVASVEYRDEDGTWQTMSTDDYEVSTVESPGEIHLKPDASWPSGIYTGADPVRVTFDCGHTEAAAVPRILKQAIMLQAAFFYENRVHIKDRIFYNLTRSVDALLSLGKVRLIKR